MNTTDHHAAKQSYRLTQQIALLILNSDVGPAVALTAVLDALAVTILAAADPDQIEEAIKITQEQLPVLVHSRQERSQ